MSSLYVVVSPKVSNSGFHLHHSYVGHCSLSEIYLIHTTVWQFAHIPTYTDKSLLFQFLRLVSVPVMKPGTLCVLNL